MLLRSVGPQSPRAAAQFRVVSQSMNISAQDLKELIERTKKDFRFKYVGGGYFRDKTIPQGEKAEVKHGEEIIDEFCQELIKCVTN